MSDVAAQPSSNESHQSTRNTHTPGPWATKHREGSDSDYRTEVFSEQYGGIATCDWTPKNCGNGVTETYREANARLIAAAPDLLAALKGLTQAIHFFNAPVLTDNAKAAIEKATGAVFAGSRDRRPLDDAAT